MSIQRESQRHREAFEFWYESARQVSKTAEKFHVSLRAVRNWIDKFSWHELADKRDIAAAQASEAEAVERRRKMLIAQREAGAALVTSSMRFLAATLRNGETPVDNIKDAMLALKEGFALQRQSEGFPDWIIEIVNMTDEELEADIADMDRRRRAALPHLYENEAPPPNE